MLGNENALWLLFFIPLVLVPAYAISFYKKHKATKKFAEQGLLRLIVRSCRDHLVFGIGMKLDGLHASDA